MTDGGQVILLVEDDENDVFFLRRALGKAGLEVSLHLVTDGEEALQYLYGEGKFADRATHPLPNVIFLDLKLPYVGGLEVLGRIKDRPMMEKIEVIVLTSSSEERDRKRALELGAKEYLVKPATPKTLLKILSKVETRMNAGEVT